ncbi:MAG: GNAT family N-acetyltransferase [Burkholderiales bacterium PBB3]|nr:MAG: GNAT family N-acetyltransferase [Burkholderiales bacterium PBB3]
MNPKHISITVREAQVQDVEAIAPLFDAYRQFYKQAADAALAAEFIRARLVSKESTIFLASTADGQAVGFCQLYPSFCSVIARPIGVLYDLFVSPAVREGGVGRALMQAAERYAQTAGWARLDLTTAKTNTQAQALYESQGWVRDEVFYAYNKVTGP